MTDEKARRVKGKLEQSKSKLDTLLNITKAINNNSSSNELFTILRSVLTEDLEIAKLALFTNNSKKWELSLAEGVEHSVCRQINIPTLIETYSDIGIINENTSGKYLNIFDIIIPVFHKDQPLAYMVLADIEGEKIEISPIIKHLRFIQTLINIIVVALENKRLNKEHIQQVAIKKELELAQNMQSLLFPKSLPDNEMLRVKALYLPHSEVGGDYYDVISLQDGKTALCIADVSGKGMSAALLMANFQANLRASIKVANGIEDLIRICNKRVIESANYEKFITLFVGIFDPVAKTLSYVNAGHQPAVLVQEKGTILLHEGCTILGMFDELPFLTSKTISLGANDKLVCFTDGLTEIEIVKGSQLEAEGIAKLIEKKLSLTEITNTIKETIRIVEDQLEDDITFLAANFLS
ncbi:MAG: SpoIIE family protein phosphatase [Flavobacteriales bacterium]|nr:SpoIIE family protein phosphatase [Flavobacteriales bacterium]